jgi:hypothetical protein
MNDEVTIARIYRHAADHGKCKSLMEEILNVLHDQQHLAAIADADDGAEVQRILFF